jgi:hypothetical protein
MGFMRSGAFLLRHAISPVVCRYGLLAPQPYGLPSPSRRLNGIGLTGHPVLGGLKCASRTFLPRRLSGFGARKSSIPAYHQALMKCRRARILSRNLPALGRGISTRDRLCSGEGETSEAGREAGLGHERYFAIEHRAGIVPYDPLHFLHPWRSDVRREAFQGPHMHLACPGGNTRRGAREWRLKATFYLFLNRLARSP